MFGILKSVQNLDSGPTSLSYEKEVGDERLVNGFALRRVLAAFPFCVVIIPAADAKISVSTGRAELVDRAT